MTATLQTTVKEVPDDLSDPDLSFHFRGRRLQSQLLSVETLAAHGVEELPGEELTVGFDQKAGLLLNGEKFGKPNQRPFGTIAVELGGEFRKSLRFGHDLRAQGGACRSRDAP
jgi:hypothetical protein